MALDFSTPGALFLFFILAAILNSLLRALGPGFALSRSELIVVYVMMITASSLATMGFIEYLLPIIAGWSYYATPENRWAELIGPHVPDWIAPKDATAIKNFFEGMPEGSAIPWGVWMKPLIAWVVFAFSLYLVMTCIMVILRKQWMEQERLIYPLAQVPLEMVDEGEKRSVVNPFFKNKLMWIGFAIPFIISSINALHYYFPFIPSIHLAQSLYIFRRTIGIQCRVSFPIVGFSYLINLDIAFSLWFFNLFSTVLQGLFNIAGIASTERLAFGAASRPILAHQGMGALIVLVLMNLWIGKRHLRDVFRKAFAGAPEVDDTGEILSYRGAVFGLIGGALVMGVWLWRAGLPAWIVPLFLIAAFILFVGLTRIVVQGGVAAAVASMIAPCVIVSGIGSSALGSSGVVSMGFTFSWAADMRTFVMVSCANGLKLAQDIVGSKRRLFWAMMLAIVLTMGGATWMILKLAYTHGGINLNQWFFTYTGPWEYFSPMLDAAVPACIGGWIHTGVGAVAMVFLMLAQHRFLWWPLHPLGYPIGAVWIMDVIWFSIFLAWISKTVALKYGGARLYRTLRPFFLGLILGQFVAAGTWLIIDYFTGTVGNIVFWV